MLRSSSVRGLALAIVLAVCLPVAAWAQQAAEDDVYVVRPGDTCGSVARKVFGDATTGSTRLHALNKMGPPPHQLQPGTVLRIKGDPDAHLTFIRPEVNSKRAGKGEWREANKGQGLWRLDSVNTLREAGAEVTFRDETRMQMNENALVVIYGETVAPEGLKSLARALGVGRYYARVRAVDAAGLVGKVSAVRRVEVLRVKTERGVVGPQGLQGTYPLELAVEGAESLELRLDGVPTTSPVRVETVGTHTLELRPRGVPDARPETLTLTVTPPRVDVDLEPVAGDDTGGARDARR